MRRPDGLRTARSNAWSSNNTANAAYIAQFNNGCTPITPVVVNAVETDACGCTSEASATATGSISGYTYEWFDGLYTSIGQNTATATGLCPGTYHVIGTSSIGCPDTATVNIVGLPVALAGSDSVVSVCAATSIVSLFGLLGGAPDPGGVWIGPSSLGGGDLGNFDPASNTAGVYTDIAGTAPCQDSAEVFVTIDTPGNPGSNGTVSMCFGDPSADLFLALGGTPDLGGSWSPVLSSGSGSFDMHRPRRKLYVHSSCKRNCPAQDATVVVGVNSCCTTLDTVDYVVWYGTTIPDIPGATFHTTPQNWAVRTGGSSVYMNFQNGYQGVAYDRVYDVCIGQTYQFSAWFSNTWGGTPDVDLQLTVYDGAGGVIYQVANLIVGGPWVQFNTGQFTATTIIRFEVVTNIAGVGNNDCSMMIYRAFYVMNNANAGLYCSVDASVICTIPY